MKKASVICLQEYEASPLSFWVHRHLEADAWVNANQFDPPLPGPVPGRGWAQFVVEFNGITLRFPSSAEPNHFVDVARAWEFADGAGLLPNGEWVFIEANAAWGAGLNGCDAHQVLACIATASRAR